MPEMGRDDWSWPAKPTTEAEFNSMMVSLDTHLARSGLLPFQRPLNAQRLVSMRLGLSGTTFGPLSAPMRTEPFNPTDTLMRVAEWLHANYGQRLNPHFESRSIALDLHGTLWRMRLPIVYGTIHWFFDPNLSNDEKALGTNSPATGNVLNLIEHFTPTYASRLSQPDIKGIAYTFTLGFEAIEALESLTGHQLFDLARLDYTHSVDALISGMWSKAWWETAQTLEKLMKGLLSLERQPFPKGRQGHDISTVGKAFGDFFGVNLPASRLRAIDCKADVRYGDAEATREDAFAAHDALLNLVPLLARTHYNHPTRSS